MRQFVIGKKGTQPFSIPESKERVCDEHAIVTLDDNGIWTIEDIPSSNGTFIYNSQGILLKVKKKQITEFTKIVLTDTTSMGFSFIAHHLLEQDPNNYRLEFAHVVNEAKEVKQKYAEIEEKVKQRRVYLSLIPVMASCIFGIVMRFIFHDNPNIIFMVIGMMSAVTALLNVLVTAYANKDNSLKEYAVRMQHIITCPKCNRPLTDYDINNQICPICKAHA